MKLMMGGGFAVAGYSARKIVLGKGVELAPLLYYSERQPPPVLRDAEDMPSIRKEILGTTGMCICGISPVGAEPASIHREITRHFGSYIKISLSFLMTAEGAKMVIEVDSQATLY
jgi:hypothetical protein